MSSNVSPCGRYEYTGETKKVDGVVVKRYRVRDDADPTKLPTALSQGVEMGFISDWSVLLGNAIVLPAGALIGGCAYDQSVIHGVVKHSYLSGHTRVEIGARLSGVVARGALINSRAFVENSDLYNGARVGSGAHIVDAEVHYRVGGDAEVLDQGHIMELIARTTADLGTALYRAKGGVAMVQMGCWRGTLDELEELFMRDRWVETEGEDCERLRPEMLAMVALFRARVATW